MNRLTVEPGPEAPLVSVIVPCYNEAKFIGPLIENLQQQDYPTDRLELLLIDGQSQDTTQEIIGLYRKHDPRIKLLINEKRFAPFALNLGIRQAAGEVIIRMDAHAVYPENYIRQLVENLFELKADNVGGRWITVPANDSMTARTIAVALSSVFGVGDASFRLKPAGSCPVDTVPFGCFRRSLFDRIGYFDEELLRNQDDEFNARILQNGGAIYLIPDIAITYFARPDLKSLSRMYYQYGYFKPLVNLKLKKPATIRQFIPPLFVLFLLIGWVPGIFCPPLFIGYCAGIALYLAAGLFFALKEGIRSRQFFLFPYLPVVFFIQHFSYGSGYLAGIFRFVFMRKRALHLQNSR
ncbi:MAG TPA: glycosyltransferase family 2 protein [Bacteroidales bacterium]|nr:glycosyltransferase family 2 protein [Bacteroidales bacterium]HPT09434.1 glycosyltransferase family 2 protein [Bacteroidales bacterium]